MRIAVVLSVVLSASPLLAAGWSGFGGTAARDHHTDETLATSLHLAWSRQARHAPSPAWPRDDRMSFDRVNRVAVSEGRVFYGSSVDGLIRCLDAKTGQTRWTFATGGPVRFAPAVWRDRVFVTSDDGYLYSLATADGRLLKRWRGGPTDQRVMGNGHVISRWPARGGVVISGDIVYWAAGIWQSEGIFIRAQQAVRRMLPADQRLRPHCSPRPQIAQRLVMEHQPTVLNRVPQLAGQHRPAVRRGIRVRRIN